MQETVNWQVTLLWDTKKRFNLTKAITVFVLLSACAGNGLGKDLLEGYWQSSVEPHPPAALSLNGCKLRAWTHLSGHFYHLSSHMGTFSYLETYHNHLKVISLGSSSHSIVLEQDKQAVNDLAYILPEWRQGELQQRAETAQSYSGHLTMEINIWIIQYGHLNILSQGRQRELQQWAETAQSYSGHLTMEIKI